MCSVPDNRCPSDCSRPCGTWGVSVSTRSVTAKKTTKNGLLFHVWCNWGLVYLTCVKWSKVSTHNNFCRLQAGTIVIWEPLSEQNCCATWLHVLPAVRFTLTLPFCLQVGLFRKSGVKSRIQALRQMNESSPDNVNYEDQSAYDVADMVKQFFRDLPEPLLTSKLGETFLHIYQCKASKHISLD